MLFQRRAKYSRAFIVVISGYAKIEQKEIVNA
jgi:hypothetical protein